MARNEALWLLAHERRSVEIAATFVARYRVDNLKSGDVSLLIGLLAKLGFSPRERGALNLAHKQKPKVSACGARFCLTTVTDESTSLPGIIWMQLYGQR
jgi:hypothetical protein